MTEENKEHIEVPLNEEEKTPEVVVSEEETPPQDEKIEKTSEISAEEGINEMKKKLQAAEEARREAEKRAYEASQQAKRASSETRDANYQLVVNAIETVKGRAEAIKQAYASAMAAGDFDKAAQLQEAMSVNAQQLAELKRGEQAMKEELKRPEPKASPEPSNEPMIDQIARRVSPKSAAWLRENRETLDNERMIRRMFRAHEDAVDEGIDPDTDDYFSFIEGRLGIAKQAEEAPAPTRRPASPPPAAPVSRGGQRPSVVRLSREQVEMAKMMGMSESDYAKNMVALQREGKMGH